MGKLKNMMIDRDYFDANVTVSQTLFTLSDYQDKKHFLAARPQEGKFPYARACGDIGCIVLIVSMVSLCLFL